MVLLLLVAMCWVGGCVISSVDAAVVSGGGVAVFVCLSICDKEKWTSLSALMLYS